MDENVNQQDLLQYLDICQRALRKYIALNGDQFEVEHAILMLECNVICKNNLENPLYGDMICFLCASICIDCMDPLKSTNSVDLTDKYRRIHEYIRAGQQGADHGKQSIGQ